MIYSRWGKVVLIVRYATKQDAERLSPPLDDEAKINLANKSWVVIQDERGNQEISHLGFLRADGGLPEIGSVMDRWMWECPDCDEHWPNDEVCHNAKCRQTQQRRAKRWHEKQTA